MEVKADLIELKAFREYALAFLRASFIQINTNHQQLFNSVILASKPAPNKLFKPFATLTWMLSRQHPLT